MGATSELVDYSRKKDICALLWPLYFWSFIAVRPLLHVDRSYSTTILLVIAVIFLIVYIFYTMINFNKTSMNIGVLFIAIVFILFLIDMLFRSNSQLFDYFYQFISSTGLLLFFITQVKNARLLVKYYCYISTIMFILYCPLPFVQTELLFAGYMEFGFKFALPAYIGLYIGRNYFGFKWTFLLEILCIVEIVIFANRSVLLGVLLLVLMENITRKIDGKQFLKLVALFAAGLIVLINIEKIVNTVYDQVTNWGYSSYALSKTMMFFQSVDTTNFLSGRNLIWESAQLFMQDHLLIGQGVASFQAAFGIYPHNLFLEIMITWGGIGLLFMTVFMVKGIKLLFILDGGEKLLGIILFCLWCPKLLLSNSLFLEASFWSFIIWGLIRGSTSKQQWNSMSFVLNTNNTHKVIGE